MTVDRALLVGIITRLLIAAFSVQLGKWGVDAAQANNMFAGVAEVAVSALTFGLTVAWSVAQRNKMVKAVVDAAKEGEAKP